jgi:hypothetical protein
MGVASRFAAKAAAKAAGKAAAKAEGKAARLAVNPKPRLALPAPPKPLALPAPGPGLPPFAVKPRGGQFYPDVSLGPRDAQAAGYKLDNYTDREGIDRYAVRTPEGLSPPNYVASTPESGWQFADAHFQARTPVNNRSPEAAARMARADYGLTQYNIDEAPTPQAQLGDWLERTLAKYYKTDFGSPNDPLRELAERGMHYDPEMTPERWQQSVNDSLMEDPIGYFTVPRHENEIRAQFAGAPEDFSSYSATDPVAAGTLMQAAPWLRKQPVTDKLYGIQDTLDLGHFVDEMNNAIQPEGSGLPFDLAVRPESLDRMTFAQAAEHVGKINRFRAKEMDRVSLSRLNSPAVQTFKEYADDNPMGLRWTELKAPDPETYYNLQEVDEGRGKFWRATDPDTGEVFPLGGTREQALESLGYTARGPLQDALKYEGDTMGHCVGGYCDDVASGQSRIFSLRDAKGEPHVTIETAPVLTGISGDILNQMEPGIWDKIVSEGGHYDTFDWLKNNRPDLLARFDDRPTEEIIQIKGKQNRAPKDDYLPFVQDFVKSGKWSNVGDLRNTNLVRLPDGRYLDNSVVKARLEQRAKDRGNYNPEYWDRERDKYHNGLDPEQWDQVKDYFEGYAIGGRVSADRCFSKGKSAVYAVNKSRK